MKKSSFIILTILASLSLSVCQAQETTPPANTITTDTAIVDDNDTTRYYYQQQQNYNYYFRSRLWDNLFRICFRRRYYATIHRPGYMPRHLRGERGRGGYASHHHTPFSHKRGGFGHFGSHHSVVG
jgi:hypothetical protein